MGAFDDLVPSSAVTTAGAFDDLLPTTSAGSFDDLVPKSALAQQVTPQTTFQSLEPPRGSFGLGTAETIGTAEPRGPLKTIFPSTSKLFESVPSRLKASSLPFRVAWDVLNIPSRVFKSIEFHASIGLSPKAAIRAGFADAELPSEEAEKFSMLTDLFLFPARGGLLVEGAKAAAIPGEARVFRRFLADLLKRTKGEFVPIPLPRLGAEQLASLTPVERKATLQAVETVSSRIGQLPTATEIAAERLRGTGTGALKSAQQLALERLGLPQEALQGPLREQAVLAGRLEEIASPAKPQAAMPGLVEGAALPKPLPGVSVSPEATRIGQPTRFAERVATSPETPQEMAQGIRSLYTPISNPETLAKANARIAQGTDQAYAFARDADFSAEAVATGEVLIKRLQGSGDYDRAIELAESVSEKATAAGQGIQALAMWSRLTPEGILRYAATVFQRINRTRADVVKRIPRHKDTVGRTLQDLFKDAL